MHFQSIVSGNPDKAAVVFDRERLSYSELDTRSNTIAGELYAKGIGKGDVVSIFLDRGVNAIVAMLGVLKSGAAFCNINLDYPQKRVAFILNDVKPKLIIDESFINQLGVTQPKLKQNISPNDLAVVVYTSGSTGKPKGVLLPHRALDLSLEGMMCGCGSEDSFLLPSPLSFIGGIAYVLASLAAGITLHLTTEQVRRDVGLIIEYIQKHNVTAGFLPPRVARLFLERGDGLLRVIITGAEKVSFVYSKKTRIFNVYGASETFGPVTSFEINEIHENGIPIGKAFSSSRIYLLDDNGNHVPDGQIGEICVSGQVADGYVNLPSITDERFVTFNNSMMYKSGDLGRKRNDGNIEYVQRKGWMVKIRGYRVEPSEIESSLLEMENVREAVVIAHVDENGNTYLCAYLVTDKEFSVSEYRERLGESLPEYMVPSYYVRMESLPLTPNGKIDRMTLPLPTRVTAGTEYVAPRNEVEEVLAKIWKDVLNKEKVGIYDNFFELGGHSLKGMIMASKIHKKLNIEIPLGELFKTPNIAGLSKLVESVIESPYKSIEIAEEKEYYDVSYAQLRMWIINQTQPDSTKFNIPGRFIFNENIDKNIIQSIWNTLVKRHDSFRTRFEERNGRVVQVIEKGIILEVGFIDLTSMPLDDAGEERERVYEELSEKIFNLNTGPLIDVKLIKVSEQIYDVLYCLHHIIADGWSINVLRKEFLLLHEAYKEKNGAVELTPLRVQYKDFSEWQNGIIRESEFSDAAKDFWKKQINEEFPILNLPFDQRRSDSKTGNSYLVSIDKTVKYKLKEIAQSCDTSLYMVLLTSFIAFLSDLTKQNEILIGTAASGREHEDIQGIIGCFINPVVLINVVDRELEFTDLVKKINDSTLNALKYQSYPLELIVEELNIKYPNITAFFNMINFGDITDVNADSIEHRPVHDIVDVKFDLEWYVTEHLNAVQIMCVYNKGLFEPTTIEYIMNRYHQFATLLSENTKMTIRDCFESEGEDFSFFDE